MDGMCGEMRQKMIDYKVQRIPKKETYPWLLEKHYAHRLPMAIEYSFGLYKNKILNGVCVFGPTAPTVPITIFGEIKKYKVRELTRLVVNDNLGKNVLSYFVSNSIKLMPKPLCLISFADENMNHHGYIYQATNWIYTGVGGNKHNWINSNGEKIHSLTIYDRMKAGNYINEDDYLKDNNIKKVEAEPKHRYLYFVGTKKEKRKKRNEK